MLIILFIIIVLLVTVIFYLFKKQKSNIKKIEVLKQKEILELESRNAHRNAFFSTMAHEIRTPLNGVIVATKLLKEHKLPKESHELIEIIHNSGSLLINVVNDVLDLSKIEAGKMTLDYKSFKLEKLLNEIVFFFEPQFKERGLYLHYKIEDNLKKEIYSDPTRLKQILFNIVGNAIKFTKQGGVSISITKDNEFLRFEISDTGIGIKEEDIPRLFETYTQSKGQSSELGGTGLGLNICKNLSELLGGYLKIESTFGMGSKFTVTVKLEDNVIVQENLPDKKEKISQKDLSELNILLVDDNDVNRKVAGLILKKKNISPDIAENGKIALEKASQKKYDLILMDLNMPVMDGIEACEKLIETTPYNELPLIVALSANAFKEDKDECYNAGMNGFLTKPLSFSQLDEYLELALKRKVS